MSTVLLIGAGNLGRRHLQGLKRCSHDIDIVVIDPVAESLRLAQESFDAAECAGKVQSVIMRNALDEFEGVADLAIVATTAAGRLGIVDALASRGVKNVILEKVAFNSVPDIDRATELVRDNKIRGWVNCPRRLNRFYTELVAELSEQRIERFSVTGHNYGMACNAIHFLDLFAFLSGRISYDIDLDGVRDVIPGKRDGYVEFFGKITGQFAGGAEFVLNCDASGDGVKFVVEIETDSAHYRIDEVSKVVEVSGEFAAGRERVSFLQPFQSEITGKVADEVLERGACLLTGFDESMRLHRPFIDAAYRLYASRFGGNENKMVPIT